MGECSLYMIYYDILCKVARMLVSELYSVFASSCVVPLSCIELLTMYGYYCSWVRVNPAQYGKIKKATPLNYC